MEIHFGVLVLCAFLGLVIGAITGQDPWKLVGSLAVVVLILPLFLITLQSDPEAMKAMSDRYIEYVIAKFPSMIIGEMAGVVASKIFRAFKLFK